MIIDAHIHLWNRLHGEQSGVDREALVWGRAREGNRVYYAAPPSFEDSLSTCERALAHMDWLGIERAVVLQEFMDGKQDDYLAEVRRMHPARFSCLALFDQECCDDPPGAFTRAIHDRNLQGFLVLNPSQTPDIAIPYLLPLWKTCAEYGLPIVLKNGVPAQVRRLAKLVPELRIVLSHFAGVSGPVDEYYERLDIVASTPTVSVDCGGMTFRQRCPFRQAKEKLHEAVELVGAEKIAWGSDYPRPGLVADASYRQQLEFITIDCDFLTDVQREQILAGTALRVYNWDA